jgi:hypothetical protein
LKAFADQNGKFIALEDHYDEVTFLEGGRRAGQARAQVASNGSMGSALAEKLKAVLKK